MNKRIICLILTVVMLALSLVGCGYSLQNDENLDQYVEFDAKAFKDALKALRIDEGDFTADPETRRQKVEDAIYAALAKASTTATTKQTGGVIGEHDVLYYCYYITFEDGEGDAKKTIYIAPNQMKTSAAASVQLGQNITTDLEKEILDKISGFDFTDKAYSSSTSGRAEAGTVAYISYHYSYTVTENGKDVVKEKDVTLERVTLTKGDPIHDLLISVKEEGKDTYKTGVGQAIGVASKETVTITNGYYLNNEFVNDDEIKISNAKIEFVPKGEAITVFEDTTYTEKTTMKDIYKNDWDLKDRKLTYHVYPYAYQKVDVLNATNIINLIYGAKFTEDVAKSIVFGPDFASKSDADKKALLDGFKIATSGSETKDFVTAVNELSKLITAYNTAEDTLEKEEANLKDAKTKEAAAKVEAEKEGATKEAKDAYTAAKKTTASCQEAVNKAEKALAEAKDKRDEAFIAFLAKDEVFAKNLFEAKKAYDAAVADEAAKKAAAEKEGATQADKDAYNTAKDTTAAKKSAYDALNTQVAEKTAAVEKLVCDGYTKVKYDELQTAYRTEIKNSLASAIYKLIDEKVKVVGYPEDAVDEAYEDLINDYKYKFYNGKASSTGSSSSSTSNVTNYSKYNGSFQDYLIATVTSEITTVESYADAKTAVRAHAQELVAPVIKVTVAAKALDLLYTDDEFEQYKKDHSMENEDEHGHNHSSYEENEYIYGESTVRNALQFDKLMNWLLESKEVKGENGMITDDYNELGRINVKFN